MNQIGIISASVFNILSEDANNNRYGLCPTLCADVAPLSSASLSAVVSEYGVRKAIDAIETEVGVTGYNLSGHNVSAGMIGFFKEFDTTSNYMKYRSIKAHPSVSSRIQVETVSGDIKELSPGNNISGEVIRITYNGANTSSGSYRQPNGFVQGGRYQMASVVPALNGFEVFNFQGNDTDTDYVLYRANGVCKEDYTLPILSNDETTTICKEWKDTDMSVAKIGVRIRPENAFYENNEKIYIGTDYDQTNNKLNNVFGYFYTATYDKILNGGGLDGDGNTIVAGEWRKFYYTGDLSANQYSYFDSPDTIYVSADNFVTIAQGVGNTDGEVTNTYDKIGRYFGTFEYRIWYDMVRYDAPLEPPRQLNYGYGIGNYYKQIKAKYIEEDYGELDGNQAIVDRLDFSTDTFTFDTSFLPPVPSYLSNGNPTNVFSGGAVENDSVGFVLPSTSQYNSTPGSPYNKQKLAYRLNWSNQVYSWDEAISTASLGSMNNGGYYTSHQNDTPSKEGTFGYFCCAQYSNAFRGAAKYTFSTGNLEIIVGISFSNTFFNMSGCGNDVACYFVSTRLEQIVKIKYDNDTVVYGAGNSKTWDDQMTGVNPKDFPTAVTDGVSYGWFRPYTKGKVTIDGSKVGGPLYELDMENETIQAIYGSLSQYWFYRSCSSYSYTNGYFQSGAYTKFTTDKFNYTTKTVSTLRDPGVRRANQIPTQSP